MRKNRTIRQREHTKRRARERLALSLDNASLIDAIRSIQSGMAKHLLRQTNRVSLFLVDTSGVRWIAVYDKHTKTIATCLTVQMALERWPELRLKLA